MSSDELVSIVDKDNQIIGMAPRGVMRRDRLIHRATYILVSNSSRELLVQKRTITKDIYPGFLEMAVGGVVRHGEGYGESARRELEEEAGIKGARLNMLFDFYFQDHSNRVWGRAFSCLWDGPLTCQKEEVEWGRFFKVKELAAMMEKGKFTPDSVYLYKICREKGILP